MSRPLSEIYIERGQLQERIVQQRRRLTESAQPIVRALHHVDSGCLYAQRGAQWLRQHPELLVLAALLLCFKKPRLCLRWLKHAFVTWRIVKTWQHTWQDAWQPVRSWLQKKWRA